MPISRLTIFTGLEAVTADSDTSATLASMGASQFVSLAFASPAQDWREYRNKATRLPGTCAICSRRLLEILGGSSGD